MSEISLTFDIRHSSFGNSSFPGCGKIDWRNLRGLGNVMKFPVWEIITNAVDSRSEP